MVDKMWSEKTPNIPCGRAFVLRALRPENTREKGKSVSFCQHHAKCENVYLDLIRKFKPYILKSLLSVRFGWLRLEEVQLKKQNKKKHTKLECINNYAGKKQKRTINNAWNLQSPRANSVVSFTLKEHR